MVPAVQTRNLTLPAIRAVPKFTKRNRETVSQVETAVVKTDIACRMRAARGQTTSDRFQKDKIDRGFVSPAITTVQAKQAVTGSRAFMLIGRETAKQDALTGMFKLGRIGEPGRPLTSCSLHADFIVQEVHSILWILDQDPNLLRR